MEPSSASQQRELYRTVQVLNEEPLIQYQKAAERSQSTEKEAQSDSIVYSNVQ